jgi:hypothetical protein
MLRVMKNAVLVIALALGFANLAHASSFRYRCEFVSGDDTQLNGSKLELEISRATVRGTVIGKEFKAQYDSSYKPNQNIEMTHYQGDEALGGILEAQPQDAKFVLVDNALRDGAIYGHIKLQSLSESVFESDTYSCSLER